MSRQLQRNATPLFQTFRHSWKKLTWTKTIFVVPTALTLQKITRKPKIQAKRKTQDTCFRYRRKPDIVLLFFNFNIMIMPLNCELVFASLLQVPRSRRSQTQRIGDVFPKYPPSEYARHHSPLAPRTPLTPAYVGRQMSQRDPHYLPGPPGKMMLDFIICWREQLTVSAPLHVLGGTNPFSNLPPHLTEAGKIFTSKDLFSSCFELLNLQGSDWHTSQTVSRPRPYRKAMSMVHPPETVKNFQ